MKLLKPAHLRTVAVGVGFAIVATFGLAGPAQADERPSGTAIAIEKAVEDANQAPAAENDAVSLPANGDDSATLVSEEGAIEFDLPATGDVEEATDAGVLLVGTGDDTRIAVESTDHGVRALIHLDSEAAPERFEFRVSGDATKLNLNDDGSVDALDADGNAVATAMPAWAVDATGRKVPTHYEVDGTNLVQIVEHRGGGFEYGITADPA